MFTDILTDFPMTDPDSIQPIDRYGFLGGQQYTDPNRDYRASVEVIRAREIKWTKMCRNWEYWSTVGVKKLHSRCRKGIPDSMRCEAWQRLVNSPTAGFSHDRVFLHQNGPRDQDSRSFTQHSLGSGGSRSLPTVMINYRNRTHKAETTRQSRSKNSSVLLESTKKDQIKSGSSKFRLFGSFLRLSHQKEDVNINLPDSFPLQQSNFRQSTSDASSQLCDRKIRTYSAVLPSVDYLGLPFLSYSNTSTCISTDNNSVTTDENFHMASNSWISQNSDDCRDAHGDIRNRHTSGIVYDSSFVNSQEIFSSDGQNHHAFPDSSVDSSPAYSTLSSTTSCASTSQTSDTIHSDRGKTLLAPVHPSQPDPYELYKTYSEEFGDQITNDQIRRDIHRQFPFHELFCEKNAHGRESLYSILKAYTIRHTGRGYCQGQAPLAAVLLMFMPEADAFWTFDQICERYLSFYYDDGLERVQIDGQVLFGLLRQLAPQIYKFLMKNKVDPMVLVLEWFMCVYTRTLPWACVLRVLDMFFCEGKIIIFKVGLALLIRCFSSALFRKGCDGVDEIIMRAQEIPSELDNPEELVTEIVRLPLNQRQVSHEISKQSKLWHSKMEAVAEGLNEK